MNDPKAWITKYKDIHYQMDEIRLMSCMTSEDFMLHVMGTLPEECEAVLANLENRLIAENSNKLIIKVMHQKLNAHFKRLDEK